ncbi:MAG TPA: EAL domain-containing protein [Gammaproteobacteria bacterium]
MGSTTNQKRPKYRDRNYYKVYIFALLAFLLVTLAVQVIENYEYRSSIESERANVLQHLSTIRARLEGAINSHMLMGHGLAAVIAANPDIDQKGFEQIATGLLGKNSALRNIAGAPDLVISMIYPVADNEAAIGLDYRSHPTQRETAMRAMESDEPVLAGPLPLVQGGTGIIVREPVFLKPGEPEEEPRFWGLVSSVIDAHKLYALAGLDKPDTNIKLAIRGTDGTGTAGPVFFGDATLFTQNPVTSEVTLPGGTWHIGAVLVAGWGETISRIWLIRVIGLFVALVAMVATYQILCNRIALAKTNTKLNALLNTIPDLVWLKDPNGVFLACNPKVEQLLGTGKANIIGKTDYDFFPSNIADFFRANDQAAIDAHKANINEEWLTYASDGHRELTETIKTPLFSPQGQLLGVLGIARDITGRYHNEQRITRLNRLYAVLSGINEAIIHLRDPEALYKEACRIAVEVGNFDMAWLGIVEDSSGVIQPVAHAGNTGNYLEQLNISVSDDQRGHGPTGEALRQGLHMVCNNIENDPHMLPWREAALAMGYRASAAFPLSVNGKIYGAFNLYSHTCNFFDETELQLLDKLASNIGFALEFAESDSKRHKNEQELRQQKELLERTGNLAKVGGWQFDVPTMKGSWSAETARIHDLDPDSLETTVEQGISFYSGESRETIDKALQAAIEHAQPYDLELEMITGSGNHKWIRTIGIPVLEHDKVVSIEGAIQDITKRKIAETLASQRELMLDSVFQAIPDLFFLMDEDGTILDYRAQQQATLYVPPETFLGKRMQDVLPENIGESFIEKMNSMQQQEQLVTYEYNMTLPNGEHRFEARMSKLVDSKQCIAIIRDITHQHHARQALIESEKRYRSLLENAPFPVVLTRIRDGILRYGNQRAEIRFGLKREQGIGLPASRFYQDPDERQNFLEHLLRYGSVYDREIRMIDISGKSFWALLSASIVEFENEPTIFAAINDITQHKQAEEDIRHLVHYDALTELPNRTLLNDRIEHAISIAERNKQSIALMFIDLDRFKNINDSLGHHVGDQMLIEVAKRLKLSVRKEDTVSRLGGDEFILLLVNTNVEGAAHVAEKIIQSMSRHFIIGSHELSITPSIGISIYPGDGKNADTLLQCSDSAMYRAKRGGHNTYCFFTTEMHQHASRTLQLENALRRALERNELLLHYQPQFDITNQEIIGCEALLRWKHPEFGMVSPAEFIPIAEDSGQILAIGEWVLRTAIKQNREWQKAGFKPLVMAVNISAAQFRQIGLTALVHQVLQQYKLDPGYLELELTESITMENPIVAIDVMERLHRQGVKLSIDDFGTGYSSLSYLKRFKIHKLKIDQSFVYNLTNDPEDEAIVGAVISLAKSLRLCTIAEGVETKQQLDFLRNKGCDEVQGYYLSKPLPLEEFENLLHTQQTS